MAALSYTRQEDIRDLSTGPLSHFLFARPLRNPTVPPDRTRESGRPSPDANGGRRGASEDPVNDSRARHVRDGIRLCFRVLLKGSLGEPDANHNDNDNKDSSESESENGGLSEDNYEGSEYDEDSDSDETG